jgi:peptide/nickel transport system substrate-binding protein
MSADEGELDMGSTESTEIIDIPRRADRRVSRRGLLRLTGIAAAGIAASSLLAACGGDDPTPTTAPAAATTAPAGTTPPPAQNAEPTATTAAAAPTTATGEGRRGGTLRLGANVQQLLQLDPARISIGRIAGHLLPNLFSALVQFDEQLNVVPDLAESWEISGDGLNYSFKLREGLTFHNGDSLTAEDFVYTFNRTKDPALASPHANKLESITAAEAEDDLTFNLTFSAPFAPFLAVTCSRGPGRALTPVPRRAVEEIGNDEFLLKPVGCGPFRLIPETMQSQSGFEMEAWDDWYGGRPLLDKIVVQFIPEPASQVNALAAGDIDFMNEIPPQGYAQVEGNNQVIVDRVPGTNWIGVQFNVTRPPFDNRDARMAVAKAIDKDRFVQRARFGLADPSVGAIAPSFGWAAQTAETIAENPQAYDPEAAKALAESSGLVNAKPAILASASDDRNQQELRNQLLEIGVDIEIELLEAAVYNQRWQSGDYQFDIEGSVVDADPDDNVFNFFYPTGPWNSGGWKNDEVGRLLDLTRSSSDQAERAKAFQDVMDIAREEAAFGFLYHQFDLPGYRSNVKGYRQIPEMRYLETVWLDE